MFREDPRGAPGDHANKSMKTIVKPYVPGASVRDAYRCAGVAKKRTIPLFSGYFWETLSLGDLYANSM